MNNNSKIEVWVGLFVVLAGTALLFLALQVSNLSYSSVLDKNYELYAVFKNIGGLKPRAKVTIAGVVIGRVVTMKLERNEFGEYDSIVKMAIDEDFQQLPKDSSAAILTAGLLGDNFVAIEPGLAEDNLQPGDRIIFTKQAIQLDDLIAKFATSGNKSE